MYKPWLNEEDFENVLFCSTHLYHNRTEVFYPGTGSTLKNTSTGNPSYPGGILNIPIDSHSSSYVWRLAYIQKVFPRLTEFKPDFILISAGFDAHATDVLNGGFSKLTEPDYKWVTERLVEIANTVCDGRIVSVMEGGYNTDGGGIFSPLAKSIEAHLEALLNDRGTKFIDDKV